MVRRLSYGAVCYLQAVYALILGSVEVFFPRLSAEQSMRDWPVAGTGTQRKVTACLRQYAHCASVSHVECVYRFCELAGVLPRDLRAAAANLPPLDSISLVPVILGTGKSDRNEILLGTEPRKSALYPAGTTINGLLSEDEEGNLWKLLTGGILESGWTGPQVRRYAASTEAELARIVRAASVF